MACVQDHQLAELVDGVLSVDARTKLDEHLDQCAECRALVAVLAKRSGTSTRNRAHETSASRRRSSRVAAVPLLRSGDRIGNFEITRLLGRGGMGEVYAARDVQLARKVAIKLMLADLFVDPQAITRFYREARAMARVQHPHIVTVYEVGTHGEMPYVAMELVDGAPLADVVERGPLPLGQALEFGIAVSQALEAAHRVGVLHRDLKPENIVLARGGGVRVLDFGLARLGEVDDMSTYAPTLVDGDPLEELASGPAGTPLYMAPEQWNGTATSAATDVWALGVILYELTTGEVPFQGSSVPDLARKVCDSTYGVPEAPRVSPELYQLIVRCLDRDADQRPSVIEAHDRLGAIRGQLRDSASFDLARGPASAAVSQSPRDPRRGDDKLPDEQAELRAVLESTSCSGRLWTSSPESRENHPINCINWYLAFAFCAWDGGRLPTEAEWNHAAAGGEEQRLYPWGTTPDPSASYAVFECNGDGSLPSACDPLVDVLRVGSRSPTGDGRWSHADLAGNVGEWVLDFDVEPYPMPCVDCAALPIDDIEARVTRGGHWSRPAEDITTAARAGFGAKTGGAYAGATRCARDL